MSRLDAPPAKIQRQAKHEVAMNSVHYDEGIPLQLSGEAVTKPAPHILVRWLFFRALGVVYLIAFASCAGQITGLVGAGGILPVSDFLRAVQANYGAQSYWLLPTVFWLDSGDAALQIVSWTGVLLAALAVAGVSHWALWFLLYAGYLSLALAGQVFMYFQWDALLIEAGFLAVFLDAHPTLGVWLYRWLVFRLMFMSGAVKLLSHDPAWRNLTALNYHYFTQPLPTVFGWFMHQLPGWFHAASTAAVFVIELAAPVLIFTPRRPRFIAAAAFTFLQTIIFLTGNYTFFNLLAVALGLFLLDDTFLHRFVPQWLNEQIISGAARRKESLLGRVLALAVAIEIVLVSASQTLEPFGIPSPQPVRALTRWLAPFGVTRRYGLFAVMTTTRPEIIIEGSDDGQTWVAYSFRYKAGDVRRPPAWAQPHQPRLDWQMWFAALGRAQDNPWFGNLLARLLEGSPDVLALLDRNPFPDRPPRYVRAVLYAYTFTDLPTLTTTGEWWRRELSGLYFPVISLDDVR